MNKIFYFSLLGLFYFAVLVFVSSCKGKNISTIDVSKIDVHSRNEKGETILHQVARNSNNPDDINILVQASADINAKDKHGNTPLHFAAWFNKNSKIITTLIKAGANIHAVNQSPFCYNNYYKTCFGNFTPLHFALMFNKNPEIVTILIKAGADVNIAVGNVSYQDESFYTLTSLSLYLAAKCKGV